MIEEYKNDYFDDYDKLYENEMIVKEIFFKYVFNNKLFWLIVIVNVFVYLICYGVFDWVLVYFKEVKYFMVDKFFWVYFLYEWVGILGILLCGWIFDKVFKGCCVLVGILFMVLVILVVLVYWFNLVGNLVVDMVVLVVIGFLIYGFVMLIGFYVLELVLKKVAGIVVGLIGFFGYLGGVVVVNVILGYIVDYFGWDGGFMVLVVFCVFLVFCLIYVFVGECVYYNDKFK